MRETSTGLVLGPILLRAVAFLIDWFSLVVFFLLVAPLLGFELQDGQARDGVTLAAFWVLSAIYHIGFWCWRSATPGKLAMNIYVAYPDGGAVRPDTAILRFIIYMVSFLTFGIGALISLVMILTDRDRRSLHDRVAGTMVIAGRPGAPLHIEDDIGRREEPPRP
jgi:uncharacterized RDD family membrane protein YckC